MLRAVGALLLSGVAIWICIESSLPSKSWTLVAQAIGHNHPDKVGHPMLGILGWVFLVLVPGVPAGCLLFRGLDRANASKLARCVATCAGLGLLVAAFCVMAGLLSALAVVLYIVFMIVLSLVVAGALLYAIVWFLSEMGEGSPPPRRRRSGLPRSTFVTRIKVGKRTTWYWRW